MPELIHRIRDDFPEYADKLAEMRASDGDFAAKLTEYDEVNRKVIEAETLEKPTGHFREEELKKRRAFLKDEIFHALSH